MAQELLFQTTCGASGDMILAAMIDLLDCADEFKRRFETIGLPLTITVSAAEKNHLKCRQVSISAPAAAREATWSDIEAVIAASPFSLGVKDNARRIFARIFQAEADVHHSDLKNVHLHEIGADDSLADIIGFCWLWEKLDCCPLYFTTLVTGRGTVQTRHGLLPVPPPAVLNLIRGFEFCQGEVDSELLTPTAAAILTACGRQADGRHVLKALRTGCGGGRKTFDRVPNLLRVVLGERPARDMTDRIWVLEFNLDDSSGELMAAASERIFQAGAVDIFIGTGLMKKGRPGCHWTVLCGEPEREQVVAAIFRESTAIGLRQRLEERVILQRETRTVQVGASGLRVKICTWQGRPVNIKPEFDDVCRLAEERRIPVKEAMHLVQGVIRETIGYGQD
jgi:uncharacterized protein (TIGR00299 family) protein